jgi:hypothetical protein
VDHEVQHISFTLTFHSFFDIAVSGTMDRENFSNYQNLAEQQTPKVHDNDFDTK